MKNYSRFSRTSIPRGASSIEQRFINCWQLYIWHRETFIFLEKFNTCNG